MSTAYRLKVVLSFAVLLLAGCGAFPKWTGRVFQDIQPPRLENGAFYIYAPLTGMPVWGQMSAKIFLNNIAVGTLDEGYFTRLELPPGTYRFHASTDSQMGCGGQFSPGTRYAPIDISITPNEIHSLRYSSHPEVRKATTCDRHLRIIEQKTAYKELRTLKEAKNTFH